MKKPAGVLVVVILLLALLSGCTMSSKPVPDPDPSPGGDPVITPPDNEPGEEIPTTLSALMNQNDIIELLGDDYSLKTAQDDYMFNYISELSYDGILFIFGHDKEEMTNDAHLCEIRISSNDYKFNYDFKVGDTALNAISKCEDKFDNLYDYHNDKHRFDVFKYKEKKSNGEPVETSLVITWVYDAEDTHYATKDDLPADLKIKAIRIFEPWD